MGLRSEDSFSPSHQLTAYIPPTQTIVVLWVELHLRFQKTLCGLIALRASYFPKISEKKKTTLRTKKPIPSFHGSFTIRPSMRGGGVLRLDLLIIGSIRTFSILNGCAHKWRGWRVDYGNWRWGQGRGDGGELESHFSGMIVIWQIDCYVYPATVYLKTNIKFLGVLLLKNTYWCTI